LLGEPLLGEPSLGETLLGETALYRLCNKGVNITPRGQISHPWVPSSPLRVKFTPGRGEVKNGPLAAWSSGIVSACHRGDWIFGS
jgi:hypothetical protein